MRYRSAELETRLAAAGQELHALQVSSKLVRIGFAEHPLSFPLAQNLGLRSATRSPIIGYLE
jgi:hypothetical protein